MKESIFIETKVVLKTAGTKENWQENNIKQTNVQLCFPPQTCSIVKLSLTVAFFNTTIFVKLKYTGYSTACTSCYNRPVNQYKQGNFNNLQMHPNS